MSDLIRREDAISRKSVSAWLCNVGQTKLAEAVMDKKRFPPAVIGENRNEHVETRNDGNTIESYLEEYERQML